MIIEVGISKDLVFSLLVGVDLVLHMIDLAWIKVRMRSMVTLDDLLMAFP